MKLKEAVPWDQLPDEQKLQYTKVWYENNRRDGNEAWREWRWMLVSTVLAVALVVAILVIAWAVARAGKVETVVQVVQVDEERRLVKLGIPQKLLEYQPADSEYMNLVSEFTTKLYWRDMEPEKVRAKDDWEWLYMHACSNARKDLDNEKKKHDPFKPGPLRRRVDHDTITKTITPGSYQVNWTAHTVDKGKAERTQWTTTYTVGRIEPESLKHANRNHTGICVTGFDSQPKS